jgi:hypothetical protein
MLCTALGSQHGIIALLILPYGTADRGLLLLLLRVSCYLQGSVAVLRCCV